MCHDHDSGNGTLVYSLHLFVLCMLPVRPLRGRTGVCALTCLCLADIFYRENMNVSKALHRCLSERVCVSVCACVFTHWLCLHAHMKPVYCEKSG